MTADASLAQTSQRPFALVVKFAISATLLAVLFAQTDIDSLWRQLRAASLAGLVAAIGAYFAMVLASAWRWQFLLNAQHVPVPYVTLVNSFLVATFFNNFLPSNIGGDIIRIRDTAPQSGSKTVATLIVLVDRAIGLVGLLLVAAASATAARLASTIDPLVWPSALWAAAAGTTAALAMVIWVPGLVIRVLRPLRRIHAEWVETRLLRLADGLSRFQGAPGALAACLAGAVLVQVILVGFYYIVARSLGIGILAEHLAVIVPLSFVVQMAPVSVNGLGVREAVFSYYFVALGMSIESALVLSLLGSALILVFSLSGALLYVARR